MRFHNMEIYDELEAKEDYLEKMWDIDLTKYFDDKFYTFSTEGGTGYFAFWYYNGLECEAPIVGISGTGGEQTTVASNLNDLVCKMIHQIGFNGGWWSRYDDNENLLTLPTEEDFDDIYYDLTDNYFEQYNEEISIEKAKELLEKDREEFKERALKLIDFISEKEIDENIKKHPCFVDRVSQFDFKSTEVNHLKHEIQNEEELQKVLTVCRKLIRIYATKEQVIAGLKGNYPNYYTSDIFKDWLEEVDKEIKNKQLIEKYTDLYLEGQISTSYLEGLQEKYPEISKQKYFADWIKVSKEKNLDLLMKQRLEDVE